MLDAVAEALESWDVPVRLERVLERCRPGSVEHDGTVSMKLWLNASRFVDLIRDEHQLSNG